MLYFLPATIISLLIASYANPQAALEIEITGFRNDTGVVMLQLLNEDQTISNQAMGDIKEKRCTIIFSDLKAGKYGIRYFHDENMNGIMEKNILGIPTEGYGFSNNAYGMFGPRPFRDWLFEIKENKKLILKIKY